MTKWALTRGGQLLAAAIPATLLGILAGWMFCSLWWPFGRDQGIFAWAGDVIVHGGVPYKDAWDIKGPAVYLHYALAQQLFGRTMWGIRVIDGLLLAGALAAAGILAGRLGGRRAALWAPVFLGFWYAREGYWCVDQPDGWTAMLAVMAAALLAAAGRRGWTRIVSAGLLMGWIVLYKPVFAILVPLVLGWLWLSPGESKSRRVRLLKSAAYLASGLVPLLAVCAWMARAGSLQAMLDTVLDFNRSIYWSFGRLAPAEVVARTATGLGSRAPLLIAAGLGLVYLHRSNRAAARLLGLWCLVAVALVCVQAKFLDYHWLILLAPFSLAAGLGMSALTAWLAGSDPRALSGRAWAPALAGVLGLVLVGQPLWRVLHFERIWLDRVRGVHSWESYYAQGFNAGDFSFTADKALADYLVPRTRKDDYVFIWGSEPMVYFLSDRRCPTRFGWDFGLVWTYFLDPPRWARYKVELMDSLHTRDPAYVIVVGNDRNQVMPLTSREFLRNFPEFDQFLDGYDRETIIRNFVVWHKRGLPPEDLSSVPADRPRLPAATPAKETLPCCRWRY